MYYHKSPTVQTIKRLKQSRAASMRDLQAGMKQISANYRSILKELEDLRRKELAADQLIARFPDKADEVIGKMQHNYKLMSNKLDKFLSNTK